MAEIHKLSSPYALAQVGVIRNRESEPSDVRKALTRLGEEIGKGIASQHFLAPATIITPMDDEVHTLLPQRNTSVVVTTKADLDCFGAALASILDPAALGYMNFEGRRGFQALESPVRELELPEIHAPVDYLIIAKSTLATGCTAISLARTAMYEYSPRALIIASIFYSSLGLSELRTAFSHAPIFVVGDPDRLDERGMLHPGIGLLDSRI